MKSKKKSKNSSQNSENNKPDNRKRALIILAGVLFVALIVAATTMPRGSGPAATTTTTTQPAVKTACVAGDACSQETGDVKVEVYHFHGAIQCWSCKTLGALAEKTVNTYFKNELESGKLKFDHINIGLGQNAGIVNRYGATGSSLMIGTYKDGAFTKEADTKVWYKLNNEGDFLAYLKGVLDKRLNGDLS
jgi:hypothetical protein